MNILEYLRISIYVLVIFSTMVLPYKGFIHKANALLAIALSTSALEMILGVHERSNTAYYVINGAVFIWGIAHLHDLVSRKE